MPPGDVYICKSTDEFIPGLQLNRGFFNDVVKPILARTYPRLSYSAALTGHCSDVLGLDTYKSTDHVWGPRLQIFLSEDDHVHLAQPLFDLLARELPPIYLHFPTNYRNEEPWSRVARMQFVDGPPINHFIEIETVRSFIKGELCCILDHSPTINEWLTFPEQALLEVIAGEVFHDETGELTHARQLLAYYPDPVWFFRMYCLWGSISDEQAFAGRCYEVGDPVGEILIAARIVKKLMKLCFALERKYYPYSKWFGSAFQQLHCAGEILPHIQRTLSAPSYNEREEALCQCYLAVARLHNIAAITPEINAEVIDYYRRGYRGVDTIPFAEALKTKITPLLEQYDCSLLSKTVLYDDSNFDHTFEQTAALVNAARIFNFTE